MRRFVLVALVGVLAACGSSSGSSGSGSGSGSGSNAYVDAAMKSYDSAPASTKAFMNKSQARCLISGMVDIIGVDTLEKNGVKPNDLSTSGDSPFKAVGKDMTPAQAKDVAGLITDGECFDFTDIVVKQVEEQLEQPVRQADQGPGPVLLRREPEGEGRQAGVGAVRSSVRATRAARCPAGRARTSRSCSRSWATARSARATSGPSRGPGGRAGPQPTVRCARRRGGRSGPRSRPWTGSSVGHGQPPNPVRR